ncbi:hypothetical protein B0T17DRAFT_657547 [Bombardia bombarda]|uniref:Uncharacterized protein n=1 Tax=Bombardia bombarda TaxID=252184 RepID=A0AA39WH80_9PEZI|nr:hypothetical protein B0T17DRAFT_657547 [Bombardia bombarda]
MLALAHIHTHNPLKPKYHKHPPTPPPPQNAPETRLRDGRQPGQEGPPQRRRRCCRPRYPPADLPSIPRNKRWADVSNSANVDHKYKLAVHNPVSAYEYVCMCQPPFSNGGDDDDSDDDDSDEEEDEEEGDDENGGNEPKKTSGGRGRCDAGETCLCNKPAADHPDHPWQVTVAGKHKFYTQRIHCGTRCPDDFGMYTFNDHEGYGVMEIIQNLLLDFEEVAGSWKEQWAVCEGMAFFLLTGFASPFFGVDDGELVSHTYELIGRLFVSMLAQLERDGRLGKDSEVQNLGLIMALFMRLAADARDYGCLQESEEEPIGPKKDKKTWCPHAFDNQVLAYARKYDVKLVGPSDMEDLIENCEQEADLPKPESNKGPKADPFGFVEALASYKSERGGIAAFLSSRKKSGSAVIGGDYLDITTWSSAERKEKAFAKKDPLGKAQIDAIKKGLILQRG